MSRKGDQKRMKAEEARHQRSKEDGDTDQLRTKRNEYVRSITDSEVELKFLTAKLEYQKKVDAAELQQLNERIRDYKKQIKELNDQLTELTQELSSESFMMNKKEEDMLLDEIKRV